MQFKTRATAINIKRYNCPAANTAFPCTFSSQDYIFSISLLLSATLSYIFLHVHKIHSQVSVLSFFTIVIVNWSLDYLSILRVFVSFVQVSRRVYNIKYLMSLFICPNSKINWILYVVLYNKLSWFVSELPEKDISNVVV